MNKFEFTLWRENRLLLRDSDGLVFKIGGKLIYKINGDIYTLKKILFDLSGFSEHYE